LTRSVRSERIADLKLVYSGRGTLSRNMGRTILSWLLEWLWPF
jgi:flagellar basal body L-ring protein FlgH